MTRPQYLWLTAVTAVIISAVFLAAAFYFPLIHSSFEVDFPDWLPDWFGLHNDIEKWIIRKGKIPVGEQYLLGIIKALFDDGSLFLGTLILLFSVVFPVVKILLSVIALLPDRRGTRSGDNVLKAIGFVSKWSMADVFIVAVVIVMFKAKGFNFTFHAEAGIYFYAASAILSTLTIYLLTGARGEIVRD